jgi:hypothetical protein
MEICYVPRKFKAETQEVIDQANVICSEYAASGLSITLRQLYYQFVARDLLGNTQRNYNRLKSIISDARLAGELDWDYIVDRTRNLEKQPTWKSPKDLIDDAAKAYLTDLWAPQKRRVEVWIEKDAAVGVIEQVCNLNHIPFFSCRGYTSSSEMWNAGVRIGEYLRNGEQTVILHIGDHDPSGLDMTRDIEDRIRLFVHTDWANEFMGGVRGQSRGQIRASMRQRMRDQGCPIGDDELPFEIRRIALTIEQIEQYEPPPNFAKQTDARFEAYMEATGLDESWELDALDPLVMEELIQDHVDDLKVDEEFAKAEHAQEVDRKVLTAVSENWDRIKEVHGS